ncbi:MAG: N-acetylmuramoyl-L-alanine amidase, partial [Firmicutes bacterium]|nr:N-acetylmuramoyl-L-alanine amidase [Bacillota bacterium]
TARRLADLLARCGARVVFTRTGDEDVPEMRRIACARENGAHVFVSLHTHWSPNPNVGGPAVLYNSLDPDSEKMACLVSAALAEKVRLRLRRSRADPFLRLLGPVPGLLVEVVTISDWVEEGLLRSSRFHQKVAEGIFNGLKDYYCSRRERG